MTQEFIVRGMSCNGCKEHVEGLISSLDSVQETTVDLSTAIAVVKSSTEVDIKQLEQLFKNDGNQYSPYLPEQAPVLEMPTIQVKKEDVAYYYCPMQCEGDKNYPKQGDCPVCGMDLVPHEIAGKKGSQDHDATYRQLVFKFKIAVAFTLPIFVIAMSDMFSKNPFYQIAPVTVWNWVQFALSLPVILYATSMFFKRAYRSLLSWNLNMFTLIGIGAGVAWSFSICGLLFSNYFPDQFKTSYGTVHVYFEAATVILTLVLMGQVLEARAHKKTSLAISSLLKLSPTEAIKIINGKESLVNINSILPGDQIKVKPGGKIPVDGTIIDGQTIIDESMITGEPVPVHKTLNDSVSCGTLNGNSTIVILVEKIGQDTLLAKIIEMVSSASRSRAPIQQLADTVAKIFVPVVIAIAITTFFLWLWLGPFPSQIYALVNAIAVLIIACPCALGLATPMSIMVGVGKGAQNGILIKSATALQTLSQISTLVIDKTGTLTEGKPSVKQLYITSTKLSRPKINDYIIALSKQSEHPLAHAIISNQIEKDNKPYHIKQVQTYPGLGINGFIDGQNIALGNVAFMNKYNIHLSAEDLKLIEEEQATGKTVSIIAIDNAYVGFVTIEDKVKETAKSTIQTLQKNGLRVVMLTGDTSRTAQHIAQLLGLSDFEAGLLPEEKLQYVERLQQEGEIVGMTGDGINDAPALAKSNVGIAMGTGNDAAIENADITLINGDLSGIIKAKKLSNQVMKNIKQNLFFALVYNSIGVPIAAGILFPFFGILLSPMLAALAMSFSSVSVIANALRLKKEVL